MPSSVCVWGQECKEVATFTAGCKMTSMTWPSSHERAGGRNGLLELDQPEQWPCLSSTVQLPYWCLLLAKPIGSRWQMIQSFTLFLGCRTRQEIVEKRFREVRGEQTPPSMTWLPQSWSRASLEISYTCIYSNSLLDTYISHCFGSNIAGHL